MSAKSRIAVTIDREALGFANREARRDRQQHAAQAMDRLARKFGDWPAEKILRAARDRWQMPKKC